MPPLLGAATVARGPAALLGAATVVRAPAVQRGRGARQLRTTRRPR